MHSIAKITAGGILILSSVTTAYAEPATQAESAKQGAENLESVTVTGVRQRLYERGLLKDAIQKTEVITSESIEKNQAASLTEAISEAPGVRVNNECSMCGVKRVMLNGLRGEHTTILVDGIPTHTMISGFYGLDAVSAAGIESIEIARGAGASLIAPEAMGGTINLVTREATENGGELDISTGENGYRKTSVVATGISEDGASRLTFAAQYDNRDQFDGDKNGVSENPELENSSYTFRLSQDIGDSDNVIVRVSRVESEIFGGPTRTDIKEVLAGYRADSEATPEGVSIFEDGDVRNDYIGKDWETTEWIESTRNELSLSWLHEFNQDFNMTLTGSRNEHDQDSFYEGFFYDAEDDMTYLDARFNYALNDDHMLTFGADSRSETLESDTSAEEASRYVSDSFDYDTRGLYIQDTWTATEDLEIAFAVRFDSVEADFIDPDLDGTEIDEDIVSPRIDVRYAHNDQWTSRFNAGRGYRAPLSFFETDHGILDAELGFLIDVDDLERSRSATYSLSYEGQKLSVTGSMAYTEVENLAILTETEVEVDVPGQPEPEIILVPTLTQSEDDASVFIADIALTYQLTDELSVGASIEDVDYNDTFKEAFGVVPVEQRVVLSTDWEVSGFDVYVSATWVGSRDLSEYGTPEAPTFDDEGLLDKSTSAESFWTVDFRISKEFRKQVELYIGANNVFDYTQVNDMETPLFYEDGYDVAHIYGPLRGREAYAGIKFTF